jgi:hypothetical protein
VAPAQAVTAFYIQLLVRVVAFMALKIRHHPGAGNAGVAGKAPLGRGHAGALIRETVAVEAVEARCAHAVDEFVGMAGAAVFRLRPEKMLTMRMALLARYLSHEDVAGMSEGFPEGQGALCRLAAVACRAGLPGSLAAMGLLHVRLARNVVTEEEFVPLQEAQAVAFLAGDEMVFSHERYPSSVT